MNVYVLQEEYWHDIDGSHISVIDIYANKEDAKAKASEMNNKEGWSKDYANLSFNVVERDLL